jgi:hypothetical protein
VAELWAPPMSVVLTSGKRRRTFVAVIRGACVTVVVVLMIATLSRRAWGIVEWQVVW